MKNLNNLKCTVSAVASSGLGTVTVAAAVAGNRIFGAGDDGEVFDRIRFQDGDDWELCNGCVYDHDTLTLTRGIVEDSSAGGSRVTLSTSATVSQVGASVRSLEQGTFSWQRVLSKLTKYRTYVEYQSATNYFVAFPTAGGSPVVLCDRPSGEVGIITGVQMSLDGGQATFDARLRVFVDQEVNPSIDVDLGTLFLAHDDAHSGTQQFSGTPQIQFSISGTTCSFQMQFPMPYSDGIKIEVYTPAGVTVGGGNALFSLVYRHEGAVSPLRLRSRGQTRLEAVAASAYPANTDLTMFDIPNIAGHVAWWSMACFGAANYTFMEKPYFYYFNGESSPSWITTGGEEFGATGYYFGFGSRGSQPAVQLTAGNNSNKTMVVGWDLLEMHGGLKFDSGLKMVWSDKPGYPSPSFKAAWAMLHYVDSSVPFVPTAPQNLTCSVVASGQLTFTWQAPKSQGSAGISGYTITLDNGGGSYTVAGNVLTKTITGLTNGTSYTATVLATNPVGDSSSSGSASGTPASASVPDAPTIGTATAGDGSASVAFTPNGDGGSTILDFTVTSTPDSHTATGSASPITVSGLTNGTAYTFTARARNAVGNSSESSASNSVTPAASGPSVADTFNRSDSSSLGTTTTGSKTWTVDVASGTADCGIDSNRAKINVSGADAQAVAHVSADTKNQKVGATLAVAGTAVNYAGLVARYVDINNFVLLQYDAAASASRYAVYVKSGGSYTFFGGSTGVTPSPTDVLELQVTDNTSIDFWVNGTHFGPFDITGVGGVSTSSTVYGLAGNRAGGFNSTARWDSFSVT